MKNYIIGLHGLPRVGKTTMMDFLIEREGYAGINFSDKLYAEVAEAFNVTVEQLKTHVWKTEPQADLAIMRCSKSEFCVLMAKAEHNPREPRTTRWILQQWGTEYRRAQDPDYWLPPVEEFIAAHPDRPIVIGDVRFDNEAKVGLMSVLRDERDGNFVIEVTNKRAPESNGHDSDIRISDYLITHIVANDGTRDEFYQAVKKILESPWSC